MYTIDAFMTLADFQIKNREKLFEEFVSKDKYYGLDESSEQYRMFVESKMMTLLVEEGMSPSTMDKGINTTVQEINDDKIMKIYYQRRLSSRPPLGVGKRLLANAVS